METALSNAVLDAIDTALFQELDEQPHTGVSSSIFLLGLSLRLSLLTICIHGILEKLTDIRCLLLMGHG